jgi:hypothetical protein
MLRGFAVSRFTPVKHPQHHKTLAIEAIFEHVSRAKNLQYDLTILFPAGNRPSQLRMFG